MNVRTRRFVFILLSLFTVSAHALNLTTYKFSDSYRYSLLDDSLQEKFPGRYVVTASYGHMRSPFYYSDRELTILRKAIIDYNNVLTVGGSYYINKNVSVGFDVGAVNNNVFGNSYNTLTDSVVKSRINLLRENGFSLSVNPQVFIPTGERKNFSTQGSVGGALSVVAEQSIKRLHFLASVGAMNSKNNVYVDVDHRQMLLTQLGASYDVLDSLNINFEMWRNIPLVNDKLQDEGKYFVTAKHKTHENFSTFGGAGLSGFDKVERRTWSFFAGIKFHEAEPKPVAYVETPMHIAVAAPVRPELSPVAPIYFGHDRYDITDEERVKLDRYVEFIREHETEINGVLLEGAASAIGSRPYNQRLSERRARAVKSYLTSQGIEEKMITTLGHGEDVPQDKVEGRNRNVRFTFSDKKELL